MSKKFFLSFVNVTLYDINKRIDNFLFKKIKILSKSKIYSLLRKGNIRVNKKRVIYKYRLKKNDIIRIPLINFNNKKDIFYNKNIIYKLKKSIIYEDNYLLIINKPSGISVHSGENIKYNVIDIFKYIFFKNKYIELVHRLDKYTSGILMLAKNKNILNYLHNDFIKNKINKKYLALVWGIWPNNIKKIDNYVFLNIKKKKEKKCITYFSVIKYINNFTLLKIFPITGRKHQIRLHTSMYGYPIIFDNIYGNFKLNNYLNKIFSYNKLFLHSYYVKFFHPFLKKEIFKYISLNKKLLIIIKKLYKIKINI